MVPSARASRASASALVLMNLGAGNAVRAYLVRRRNLGSTLDQLELGVGALCVGPSVLDAHLDVPGLYVRASAGESGCAGRCRSTAAATAVVMMVALTRVATGKNGGSSALERSDD